MASTRACRLPFFYGWIVVAGAWIMYMLNQAAFTWGFTVFVEPLATEFGWSRTRITIAWALSLSWGLILGPWFGAWFDRGGSRVIFAIGGVLGGVGWMLIPTATDYWQFLAYLVLVVGTGINGAIGPSTGSAAIAQWFKLRRSLALGIYLTGSGGAGLLLIPVMSTLEQLYGWRVSAAGLGALSLALTALVAPFMRHRPEVHGMLPDGGVAPASAAATTGWREVVRRLPLPKHRVRAERQHTLAQALRDASFWLFTGAIFLRYFGMGITQVHQMPHMLREGVPAAVATAALSLSLVVNIPARVAVGWMGDVYDKRWLLNLLAIAGAVALAAFALVGREEHVWVWTYALLWGVGLAMLPLQAAWIADHFGRKHYGAINSASNSFALSGRVVGALAAAAAFDMTGSYVAIMLIGAAGFVIGAALLVLLPRV